MKPDIQHLRQNIDLEKKYVDFQTIRNSLTVLSVAEDVGTEFNEPNENGECRGDCPKCEKQRCFSLNVNTSNFNCFNPKCDLKGSGVINFASKLFETDAMEACHLLACAYGIQPYSADLSGAGLSKLKGSEKSEASKIESSFVSRSDYQKLETKHNELRREFNQLRNIIYGFMLEHEGSSNYEGNEYEPVGLH